MDNPIDHKFGIALRRLGHNWSHGLIWLRQSRQTAAIRPRSKNNAALVGKAAIPIFQQTNNLTLRPCLQSVFASRLDMRLIMARWIMASLVSGLRS